MSEQSPQVSTAALISLCALTLLGLMGGWYILLSGGFYHQYGKYHPDYTFVGDPLALIMVAIEFLMTAIGVATIAQIKNLSKAWYFFGCGTILIPPLVFVFIQMGSV
jgi:hypothetical protein